MKIGTSSTRVEENINARTYGTNRALYEWFVRAYLVQTEGWRVVQWSWCSEVWCSAVQERWHGWCMIDKETRREVRWVIQSTWYRHAGCWEIDSILCPTAAVRLFHSTPPCCCYFWLNIQITLIDWTVGWGRACVSTSTWHLYRTALYYTVQYSTV